MFNINICNIYDVLHRRVVGLRYYVELANRLSEIADAYGLPQEIKVCAVNRSFSATVLYANNDVAIVHFDVVDGKVVIDYHQSVSEILNAMINVKLLELKK